MNFHRVFRGSAGWSALLIVVVLNGAPLADAGPVGDALGRLRSPDIRVRRKAIDEIQTLDDQRIPEACLPLLQDEGNSIRRQAARAIGSRYDQMPKKRVPRFVEALERCAKDGPEDVTLLANRALGLLTGKAHAAPFSPSPDGRWLLFEQRRLPVIEDRQTRARRFLSPVHPDREMIGRDWVVEDGDLLQVDRDTKLLKLMVTNEPVEDLFQPRWQAQGAGVAVQPRIQRRFYSPISIWRAKDGAVRTWSVKSFRTLYGDHFPHWATTIAFVKWRGRKAIMRIYDVEAQEGEGFDPKGILVSVNVDNWEVGMAAGR